MTVDKAKVSAIGRSIYRENIRPHLKAAEKGKIVVIDVNSGDYEIDSDDLSAILRLLERRPDAFTWIERVGYPTAYYMSERVTPSQ